MLNNKVYDKVRGSREVFVVPVSWYLINLTIQTLLFFLDYLLLLLLYNVQQYFVYLASDSE